MRRRGVGVAAVAKKKETQAKFKEKGSEIAEDQLSQMSMQLEKFRSLLETFAKKHRSEIKRDPEFRAQFQRMCAQTGVDPLASSKGFWSEMLGIGNFYYELGVQAIEVCTATRAANGGLITLEDLHRHVTKSRGKSAQEVSLDDLLRALKKLKVLGSGFTVIPVGAGYIIQSLPGELSMDHTMVLQLAQSKGYVTQSEVIRQLKWEQHRAETVLEFMLKEGMTWIDTQAAGKETFYYFPSLFNASN